MTEIDTTGALRIPVEVVAAVALVMERLDGGGFSYMRECTPNCLQLYLMNVDARVLVNFPTVDVNCGIAEVFLKIDEGVDLVGYFLVAKVPFAHPDFDVIVFDKCVVAIDMCGV